mmetsp:Transcript_4150/g.3228  ORF Transcript_4150/g.3228 Transcript_4150/m.3228 type:complete len:84 (-) Transcript_4150:96-347(-)
MADESDEFYGHLNPELQRNLREVEGRTLKDPQHPDREKTQQILELCHVADDLKEACKKIEFLIVQQYGRLPDRAAAQGSGQTS